MIDYSIYLNFWIKKVYHFRQSRLALDFSLIFFYILMTLYSFSAFADNVDDGQFFRSSNNSIPRSTLVMSLPSPEQTPNDYLQENSIWPEIRQHFALQNQCERPEVYKWIYWLKSHPSVLSQVFQNARPYIYYIFQQTKNYQMPAEFALLPVIESAYDPNAFSSTGAVGIWQIMPGTAMIYGLNINWWYDGRRDLITSTDRALTYLSILKKNLGDWLLAAAAYDAGPQTIQRAMMAHPKQSSQESNFWYLSLSQETKDYVPKLLAIAALVANPEKYGITLPYIPNKEYFSATELDFQMDMSEIVQFSGISLHDIRQLNPGMRRWATDPDQKYTLLLPIANMQIFQDRLARVAGQNHVSWEYHEVHQGQTLESIAENYHTTMQLLRKVNKLTLNDEVFSGEGLVVPLYLHRKYGNLQNGQKEQTKIDMASAMNQKLNVAVNNITATDILSGHLSSVDNSRLEVNDTSPMNFSSHTLTQTRPADNPSLQTLANTSLQTPSTHQEMDHLPKAEDGSADPIQEKDNLKTILNKLYPNRS